MSIFVCCEREDETKYFHTCDCPILTPVNRTRNRTARMCGQSDPDADDGVYYKQIDTVYAGTYVGSGESSFTYSRDEDGVCSYEFIPRGNYCDNLFLDGGTYYTTRTTTVTLSGGASGGGGSCEDGQVSTSTVSGSYSTSSTQTSTISAGNAGCETNTTTTYTGSSSYNYSQTCCPCCSGCPTTQVSCTSSRNTDGTWSGSSTEVFFDGEETHTTVTPISGPCPTNYTNPSQSSTTYSGPVTEQEGSVTYSSADTDSDAADAAEWSEWSGVAVGGAISYDQDRNETGSFVQQEAEYAFIAKSLVIGKSYSASVVTEDCDYIKGEPENCVEGTPISVAFLANDIFKIIGGTLNLSVSRNDFVDNDYSLDPSDYNLPDGQDVIESLTPFLVSFGKKRQMVSSPILDMD
jgi:hypothetical protein